MSDYRIETKCIQSGYEPGNGEPRVLPIYHLSIVPVNRWDVCLTWKNPAIFIPDCKIQRTMQ